MRSISTWHSGSPKRTLYSISFGPSFVIISPAKSTPLYGAPRALQRAHGRMDDLVHHALVHRLGHDRRRRVGAHAAGIRPLVAVADALVVLRGGERDRGLAVAQREEAMPPRRRGTPRSRFPRPACRGRRRTSCRSRLPPPARVSATTTPLPAASPSALTTIGAPCLRT